MTLTFSDAPARRRGCVVVADAEVDAIALAVGVEREVSAHPRFLVQLDSAKVAPIAGGFRVTVRVRRLGTTGMKRRFREIYGVGPTADLAAANLIEGLDHWAEILL